MPHDAAQNSILLHLLDVTLPRGGWVMNLWSAYFDESGTGDDAPFICVSGYLFTKEKAVELDVLWSAWIREVGISHFHMTDCNAQGDEFARFSEAECDALARKAIAFIKQFASHGIALTLEKSAFDLLPESGAPLWGGSPYAALVAQVGYAIRDWVPETDRVAYVFEAGAKGQGLALSAINQFWMNPEGRALFRHGSHSFVCKKDASLLQCADILAWHWCKQATRSANGHTKMRGDFKELFKGVPTVLHHYGREELIRARRILGLPV